MDPKLTNEKSATAGDDQNVEQSSCPEPLPEPEPIQPRDDEYPNDGLPHPFTFGKTE